MSNLEFHSLLAEGDLLADQVNSVKHAAELVSQLRRVGKGLGVYQFDKDLQ
jgi:ferritin heavy chain